MKTIIKVLKTEEDYNAALKLIEELINKDPDPNSEDGEKLNLLATLVQDYESKEFPESLPDPIDAIKFRMEQQNLKPKDLVPYIGSRSKVSEVLSRKRPLTIDMIRALEKGLGIPAKVLLKETDDFRNADNLAWSRFPLKEMEKRGYFGGKLSKEINIKALMENFFRPVESPAHFLGMLRKTNYRSTRPMDKHALVVWSTAVVKKAKKIKFSTAFKIGSVDLLFMQKVAQLSVQKNGPVLAQEYLKKHGIAMIIEPHFPQTYLDGATIMIDKKHPVIALTLRHDRLDNFWFNLMHELAHVSLHFNQNFYFFYDDLDNSDSVSKEEEDADKLAGESLVPSSKWEVSPAKLIPSAMAAKSLAKEIGVHIAIVAGKIRYEGSKYVYLNKIMKQETVRKYFPDEKWAN
ncbi:ImmA/IrrE family metallo-endopeptidase [Candidatus Parcubacteria bacterium]|nr:ImmA/IrrE family metallo-endopeptidase [Patescibacteria group bacterium]MCG2691045.1 ImmA/IrrE family metallo-endopeptidase [Candidatus Parcubacteria bacterium]